MLPPSNPEPTPASESPQPPVTPATPVTPVRPVSARRSTAGRWVVGLAGLLIAFSLGIGVGRGGAFGGDVIVPGPTASPTDQAATSPSASGTAADLALIDEAWQTLHQNYVDRADLDDQALAYAAIKGMTAAVGDTGHTVFMTPAERAAEQSQLSGSYVGIGVRVDTTTDGRPIIVGVFDGSPAAQGGLKVGDIIESVDGKPTAGQNVNDAISSIRGQAGTTVTLGILSAADGVTRSITLTRAAVPLKPVSWTIVPGTHTGLLRLEQFSNGAADAVVAALKAMKDQGVDRLVFDLRGDPGGFVNEAVGIASQFLTSGNVYIERDANGKETPHPVSSDGVAPTLPLVVLVDHDTASSAEILAGALQDAKRATIVGVTTFGTGTVLGEFGLKDGSALRIGTVEWLTPSGRQIWHQGISPDVVVEQPTSAPLLTPDDVRSMTAAQAAATGDTQLNRALFLVSQATPPTS